MGQVQQSTSSGGAANVSDTLRNALAASATVSTASSTTIAKSASDKGAKGSSTNAPAAASASNSPPPFALFGFEDEEQLRSLLEARGLPRSMLSALRPNQIGQLLSRSYASSASQAQELLRRLQSDNLLQQLAALEELCNVCLALAY
jgi:hypothetical protein